MTRLPRWSGALAALALLVGAPAHAAGLITNGSFETGPAVPNPPGWSVKIPAGSAALPGWEILPGDIEYVWLYWASDNGDHSVGLNGSVPGGVAQTITTTPGARYELTFSMSGDPANAPFIKTMRVQAAGQSRDFNFDVEHFWPWGMGWVRDTLNFTATGATTRITFTSVMPDSTGPALDSVVVVQTSIPVPVPVPTNPEFSLAVAPNPARESASVHLTLHRDARVRVAVLDLSGREVARLADEIVAAGAKDLVWDGQVDGGRARPGLYFIRFTAPGTNLVRRLAFAP